MKKPFIVRTFHLLSLSGLLLTTNLLANITGNDFQLFNPTHDPDSFVTVQSTKTLQKGHLHLGVFIDAAWSTLPRVSADTATEAVRDGFEDMVLSLHPQISIGITDWWDFGITLPMVLNTQEDPETILFRTTGLTEIRAETKMRLLGEAHNGIALILGASMNLIERNPYIGQEENVLNYLIQIAADYQLGNIDLALNVGYRMRDPGTPEDVFVEGTEQPVFVPTTGDVKPINPLESNALASIAAAYNLSDKTNLIAEIYGAFATDEVDMYTKRTQSPLELLLAARYQSSENINYYGGIATEISHGVGTADYRGFLGVRWTPKVFGSTVARKKAVKRMKKIAEEPEVEEALEPEVEEAVEPTPEPAVEYVAPAETEVAAENFSAKNINFELNSSTKITRSSRNELTRVGKYLQSRGFSRLMIEGHTDSQGNDVYNQKLSQDRADTIKKFLVRNYNFKPEAIFTKGYGETLPVAQNDTAAGRKRNRRVEFKIFDN